MADYSNLRPFVYLIPTFSGNFFSLTGQASLASVGLALYGVANDSKEVIFTYGMLSFGGFSVINTALGLILFCKRDLK